MPNISSRGQARCRALLDAAAILFAEQGFALTSLSDIVERAGGSRNTLYEHFGNKEGLLRAVVKEHCARVLDDAADVQALNAMGPEMGLNRFGLHIASTLMVPETTAILRLLVSEGSRVPDVAASFFHSGLEKTVGRLAEYLRRLDESGRLHVRDPMTAAQLFTGMVVGHLLPKQLLLPDETIAVEEVEANVRQSVRLFLQGTRPSPTSWARA